MVSEYRPCTPRITTGVPRKPRPLDGMLRAPVKGSARPPGRHPNSHFCDERMLEMKRFNAADGFTLLELLIVIAVTGVLLGSTVMVASNVVSQSRADAATVSAVNTLWLA